MFGIMLRLLYSETRSISLAALTATVHEVIAIATTRIMLPMCFVLTRMYNLYTVRAPRRIDGNIYSYGPRNVRLDCKIDGVSAVDNNTYNIHLYIHTTVGREVNKLIALDASCIPAADVAGAPPASLCRCIIMYI